MELNELLLRIDGHKEQGIFSTNPYINGITHKAAWVKPGDIFMAIRGSNHDSHKFIPQAVKNGAVAIIGESLHNMSSLSVPYITVTNARKSLGDISAILHDHPSQKLTVIGVTGTKGKTTTVWLTYHLLKVGGYKAGLLSTLGYKYDDESIKHFPEHLTTPEAPQLQNILGEMLKKGCTHVVIEASSHALELMRVHNIDFDVAIWTNLAPEHLDFHKSMDNYFASKKIFIPIMRNSR